MTKARDLADGANAFDVVSATELEYLNGVSSAIQTQIDGKQAVNAAVSTTELGYLDGVTSAIQTQLDAKTAKSTLTTTGDIYYASSANTPARLGIGSTGNVLTVASGIPSWAAPAGGGKVLQVVQQDLSTATSSTSASFADTGLSLSITPTSASSKVLVMVSVQLQSYRGNNAAGWSFNIIRGSTSVWETNGIRVYQEQSGTATVLAVPNSAFYLDSPNTTSSTTYKVQMKPESTANSSNVTINSNDYGTARSTITLLEIGA